MTIDMLWLLIWNARKHLKMQRNKFESNSLKEADVTMARKFMERKKNAIDVGIASMATLQS